MKALFISCILAIVCLSLPACAPKPPNLTPVAAADFTKTRVLQDIDLIRDTAIAANAQTPPVLSTDTVRKIVLAHKGLQAIMEQDAWQAKAISGLTQLQNDLSSNEAAILTPYINLALAILQGVQ